MRVIEPSQFKKASVRRRRWPLAAIGLLLILVIVLARARPARAPVAPVPPHKQALPAPPALPIPGTPKTFSAAQFYELYNRTRYPNTVAFQSPPPVTGQAAADLRLRQAAEARGFRLTALPALAIERLNEPRLDGDDLLQPAAAAAWRQLKAAAVASGLPLQLNSAYRSPEYQRQLFLARLGALGVRADDVATGRADGAIQTALSLTALPGYSRHHTGYTVDLWCSDGSATFRASRCFEWLSADNYRTAKEAGWIPSYPEGGGPQGPEAEAWEYVWVGRQPLLN